MTLTFAAIGVRAQSHPGIEEEGSETRGKSPLRIGLTFNGARRSLRATLVNRSDKPQRYLTHQLEQPSQLVVMDSSSGQTVTFQDMRRVMKYNRAISPAAYVPIPARGSAVLEEAFFAPVEEGYYSLVWGPFHGGIAPGHYRARVVWNSEKDDFFDEETNHHGTMPGIWKGKLKSPWVEISLPKLR